MNKAKGLLMLAFILAIAAAGTVFWYIQKLEQEIATTGELETVVVARQQIPRHNVIQHNMLEERTVPLGSKIPGAFTKTQEIVGKVTVAPVFPGQQPVQGQLAEPGTIDRGLSYVLQSGYRAVTVPVDEVASVAGFVLPGDLVDVVATLDLTDQNQDTTLNTFVIEKVRLLALGSESLASTRTAAAVQFSTATLEVTVDEVAKLVVASDSGRIRLVLRPALDNGVSSIKSFELQGFIPKQ